MLDPQERDPCFQTGMSNRTGRDVVSRAWSASEFSSPMREDKARAWPSGIWTCRRESSPQGHVIHLVAPRPARMSPAKKQKHVLKVTWEAVTCDKCWGKLLLRNLHLPTVQCNWDDCTECAGLQRSRVSGSQLWDGSEDWQTVLVSDLATSKQCSNCSEFLWWNVVLNKCLREFVSWKVSSCQAELVFLRNMRRSSHLLSQRYDTGMLELDTCFAIWQEAKPKSL